jgi:hypothetical protein
VSRNLRSSPDWPHGDDLTASKRADANLLRCSRRASDAVRARACALNKSNATVLDEAIKRGLAAMPDPFRDSPLPAGTTTPPPLDADDTDDDQEIL